MSFSERIALVGAAGQLGMDIQAEAKARGLALTPLGHDAVDVTDPASLARRLAEVRPGVLINAAAIHQTEQCEQDPELAFRVNAAGALHAARAAAEVGARAVYVSTDYVFPGDKPAGHLYVETDPVRPINTYGASKLAGEYVTLSVSEDNLIVRTASLFGIAGARGKGGNFVETILGKARRGEPLEVVNDQWMTPTHARDAATAILDLVAASATGIFHVTNSGACTWHTLACAALELIGADARVEPVPARTWPSRVRRPANSALSTAKLAGVLGSALRPWPEGLRAYLSAKGHIA